jgi:CHAD domain-containing protein
MAAPTAVAFRGDQHVLAQRRQMTAADWTAIGRRLVAPRPARRPPPSRGKSGHPHIVPLPTDNDHSAHPTEARRSRPLLAAALALGVGVAAALAKAQLERRGTRKQPSKEPSSRLRRLTLEQIDLAVELLEGRGEVPAERTVHETRKALKRARALIRLQRGALGRKRFRRCNTHLRAAGRRLAGARDAEVVLDALDGLVHKHPRRLAHSAGVAALSARLHSEREAARALSSHGAHTRLLALEDLRATRLQIERWRPSVSDRKTARSGLDAIYRKGRARWRQARKSGKSPALHDWRKRVKDLRYAAEMLELRKLAKRADRLGEVIGEEHDLWLLARCLRRHRKCFKGDKRARRELSKLIARRRTRLRKRALALGKELYRPKPKRFVPRQLAH